MIPIALGAVATWITMHPKSQKLVEDAYGWAIAKVVRAVTTTPKERADKHRDKHIEAMRVALEKGDVDAIIDQFNARLEFVDKHGRVPSDPPA